MDIQDFIQGCIAFSMVVVSTIFSLPIASYVAPIFPALSGQYSFWDNYKKELKNMRDSSAKEYWFTCFMVSPLLCLALKAVIYNVWNFEVSINALFFVYSMLYPVLGFVIFVINSNK